MLFCGALSPLVQSGLLAQLLSVLLAITGISAQLLADAGVAAPTFQSFIIYVLLLATCGPFHFWSVRQKRRQQNAPTLPPDEDSFLPAHPAVGLQTVKQHSTAASAQGQYSANVSSGIRHCDYLSNPLWAYALLAVLDVEGNFLVTSAYQYTSLTSVALLDCFTIPAVMLLSCCVFGLRYKWGHLAGAALCIGGLTVLVLTDGWSATTGPRPALGDGLVLAGATVYALCNVGQERLLTSGTSAPELLATIGFFGSIFSGIQAAILERSAISAIFASRAGAGSPLSLAIGSLASFVAALYCFYITVPQVLRLGGSTVLNLSLLTSDLWSAVARVVIFGGFGGTGLYFAVAAVCEVAGIGLYVYSGGPAHLDSHGGPGAGQRSATVRYARLADETYSSVQRRAHGGVDGLADEGRALLGGISGASSARSNGDNRRGYKGVDGLAEEGRELLGRISGASSARGNGDVRRGYKDVDGLAEEGRGLLAGPSGPSSVHGSAECRRAAVQDEGDTESGGGDVDGMSLRGSRL